MEKLVFLLVLIRERFFSFLSGLDFSFYMIFGISVLCFFIYIDFSLLLMFQKLKRTWE